jgi:hypothetical protein
MVAPWPRHPPGPPITAAWQKARNLARDPWISVTMFET